MKRKGYIGCFLLMFFLISVMGLAGQSREFGSGFFYVTVQQGTDAEQGIAAHEVELQKEPFTLIFRLRYLHPLFMNLSTDPKAWEGLHAGKSLSEIFDFSEPFMGLAEYPGNLEETVYLTYLDGRYGPAGAHYLYYDDAETHSFDRVTEKEGIYIMERRVSVLQVESDEGYTGYRIHDFPGNMVYVVFLFEDGNNRQVEYVRIKFSEKTVETADER